MPFSDARADHALEFMSLCPHIKGKSAKAGLTLGDTWMDFQTEGLREMFGRVDNRGRRRYRVAFWYLPKKCGKSTLASAVALYGLFGDGEEGPEVYSVAKDREQASRVFDVAAEMRNRMPDLRAISRKIEHRKTLVYAARSGFYKVLAADADGTHGIIPSLVIFDEIHAQKDRRMWTAIEESTRTAEREEPLIFVITHAGDRPDGLWFELYEHGRAVAAGEREDPKFFPVIWGAEKDDDWTDPEVWRKSNPGLGQLVSEEEVAAACSRAQLIKSAERAFRLYQLNQIMDESMSWVHMAQWDACAQAPDERSLVGQACFAGMDLSSTTDMSALALVFPRDDGTHDTLIWYWVPEENAAERAQRDRAPYLEWIDEGLLCATPGWQIDYAFIRACLVGPTPLVRQAAAVAASEGLPFDAEEALWLAKARLAKAGLPPDGLADRYKIVEVAYDPWNATQLAIQLEEEDGFRMVQCRQGYATMNAPMKDLEGLVLSKKIRHGGHPILRWNVANVAVKEDPAGNVQPEKKKSRGRIDGFAALVMALGTAMLHRTDDAGDYVHEGIRWLGGAAE